MTIHKCPRCQTYYTVDFMVTDVVHSCPITAGSALATDDILVLGSWTDFTGSGGLLGGNLSSLGIDNTAQFTDAWRVDRESNELHTSKGNKSSLYRQRQHEEYIEVPRE